MCLPHSLHLVDCEPHIAPAMHCTRSCTAQEPAPAVCHATRPWSRDVSDRAAYLQTGGTVCSPPDRRSVHHGGHRPTSSRSLARRSDSEEWEPRRTSRGAARSSGGKAATKGPTQPASAASPSVDKPRHSQRSPQKQGSMQVQVQAASLHAWAAGILSGKPAASCHCLGQLQCMLQPPCMCHLSPAPLHASPVSSPAAGIRGR